jgi:hypothetical protein
VGLQADLSLATGHLDDFETFLECAVTAEETGLGTSNATLNLGTSGDRASLVSLHLVD